MRKLELSWVPVYVAAIVITVQITTALVLSTPVAAQRNDLVRIVENDVLFNRLIASNQALAKAITASLATRSQVGSSLFTRPIGQMGDALKVFPMAPQDPCTGPNKGGVAISQIASTRLVVGLPGMRIAVCAARLVAGAAEIPSFIEGSGTTCGTGTLAVSGSTTAANGESYAANGGFQAGNGLGTIMVTNKAGDDLCLQQSGVNRLAGNLVYAYSPY